MAPYIMALDAGTTSNRAILFDRAGQIAGVAQKEFEQFFPRPGWVEHNPEEIWSTQKFVVRDVLRKTGITAAQVAGIGITNQRETTLLWNRRTGKPVYPAIVWQDRRTAAYCDRLRAEGRTEFIRRRTGLLPDAYFSASKIRWILEEVPGVRERAERGELAFGTVDTWLCWRLTQGQVHLTDVSNASRTMLFNIHRMEWDPELLELFDIPAAILPEVRSCSELYGHTAAAHFGSEIPIAGMAGDQQAALFGQMCIHEGMTKNTYGTGCFVVMNTGNQVIESRHQLLSTVAWQLGDQVTYALEGSIFIGGAVVQWLRDQLQIIRESGEVEALAASVPDNGGVYFVPAFVGLGAPHWDQHATGALLGLTRGTGKAHIARAALESIALQTGEVIDTMTSDSGIALTGLRVDGGATANDLLMQIQADVLQTEVVRPRITETTALGAAYFAGLATGFWKDLGEIEAQWAEARTFRPQKDRAAMAALQKNWAKAVERAKGWNDGL